MKKLKKLWCKLFHTSHWRVTGRRSISGATIEVICTKCYLKWAMFILPHFEGVTFPLNEDDYIESDSSDEPHYDFLD